MGGGHQMNDFRYYRWSGSDGYRFGGERICGNAQVHGEFLESAVWHEVCDLLTHPERLEHEYQNGGKVGDSLESVEPLQAQRLKLQHELERLIDSFTEGLIEKRGASVVNQRSAATAASPRRSAAMEMAQANRT